MIIPAALVFLFIVNLMGAEPGTTNLVDAFPKSVRSLGLGGVKAAPLAGRTIGNYEAASGVLSATADYTFMQSRLPFGDDYYFAGASLRPRKKLSLSAYWSHLASPDVEITSIIDSITDADTIAYRVDDKISSSDHIVAFVVNGDVFDSLFAGISIKWIKTGAMEFKESMISSDMAFSLPFVTNSLSVGMLVRNILAMPFTDSTTTHANQREFRIGMSWHATNKKASLYGEVATFFTKSSAIESVLGIEWILNRFVETRAGLNWLSGSKEPDFSAGFTFILKGFYLEYALVTKPDFGFTGGHRLSAGYTVGLDNVD